MKNYKKRVFPVLLLAIILISCGPKVEKELKRWDLFNKSLKEAALVYPAFAEPFNTQLDIWAKEWVVVQDVADEKEKAKAMNKFLDNITWITKNIGYYTSYQKEIQKLPIEILNDLREHSGKYPELKRYEALLPIAEQKGISAIANAQNIILTAKPKTYEEASTAFSNAAKLLNLGREDLKQMDSDIQSFLSKKEEAESEAKAEAK